MIVINNINYIMDNVLIKNLNSKKKNLILIFMKIMLIVQLIKLIFVIIL